MVGYLALNKGPTSVQLFSIYRDSDLGLDDPDLQLYTDDKPHQTEE
jgi:hypothetical protein